MFVMIPDFTTIVSVDNLLLAWKEFSRGKRSKPDVQVFERDLMDNILILHEELVSGKYQHGAYEEFRINDPKPRKISKATVRDRIVHHAIHEALYPHYDRRFIADSFSCRINKGTHAGGNRFRVMARKVTTNNTKTAWVLKCDIRQFFASINHQIALVILSHDVKDQDTISLLARVIGSFGSDGKGLPLGNLTSQLIANIYMNELDQFAKKVLHEKWYVRYADDFAILHQSRDHLIEILPMIKDFLRDRLDLELHPLKVSIGTVAAGVDFLGWKHFPKHRVIRMATKDRLRRTLKASPTPETIQSYLGLLKHGDAFNLRKEVISIGELYKQ